MAKEIIMPKLGLTMKTGTVQKWLKELGDNIAEREPVVEIETEKLTHQIEAPASGMLIKKLAQAGEKYPIASVLGYIGSEGEQVDMTDNVISSAIPPAAPHATTSAAAERGGRVFISPVAKKLAASLSIDYRNIRGSGPNGRIIKADVQKYADMQRDGSVTVAVEALPYSGMRRAIGESMLLSWSQAPMVTHHVTADVTELTELRVKLNHGVDMSEKISVNDLILKLTATALAAMPAVNATMADERITTYKSVNLGMATAIPGGLVVPVIRNAERKGLLQISREARDLANRARDGRLGYDETADGTFTVTNLGGYGSVDLFTPIINPPQAAILGIGRIVDAVLPIGGEIAIRRTMGLSLTYDHRIIDGATAAEFMAVFIKLLENPARSVLL